MGAAAVVVVAALVAAVVLLPSTFSLYRPLTVSWAGVEATVTLRH